MWLCPFLCLEFRKKNLKKSSKIRFSKRNEKFSNILFFKFYIFIYVFMYVFPVNAVIKHTIVFETCAKWRKKKDVKYGKKNPT